MSWKRFGLGAVMLGAALMITSACSSSSSNNNNTTAPAVDPTSREAATADKGGEAVMKRNCPMCHGNNMAGAVKAVLPMLAPGETLDPRVELYPPNLTPDVETGIGPAEVDAGADRKGYTDELLARAIRTGVDNDDLKLCPQMKHFADMTDFEVYSIVKYLRALPPVKQKILRSVCPPLKTKDQQTMSP